jgi:RNA-directed DNA polymerase
MNGRGESDRPVVPGKSPNNARGAPRGAEGVEERGLTKGNPSQQTRNRTQCRKSLHQALERVRQAALKDREQKLNALWHHVYDTDRLREAYFNLKRTSAPGVDGETWQHYGEELEASLLDLSGRLQRGAYRAKPVVRAWIPKPDGRKRPIGVPTLEDKLVQRAAAEVIGAVYETGFKGFSYGFRPGRGQHQALDAVTVGIKQRKINWILDADIRGFFDAIDHEWMMKFIEHRIADQRVHRHVKKRLKAGVLEDGKKAVAEEGMPQGGSISPLLANIYLHYVLDDWADRWRERIAQGDTIIVRYADDIVVGFQHREDAERFLEDLRARLGKFSLELHPDKTRLIRFGRYAAKERRRRGEGKPETFTFLGFTHACGRTRNGSYQVVRRTARASMRRSLLRVKEVLRRRRHAPLPKVGRWLESVLLGHYQYFAVPGNYFSLHAYREEVAQLWRQVLCTRSQRGNVTFARLRRLAQKWLPLPRILHPWPEVRLCVNTRGRSPVR